MSEKKLSKGENLLDQSVISPNCRINESYISGFIELFMNKKPDEALQVTYKDLVEFAKKTDDTRCQRVLLFKKSVKFISNKLKEEKFDSESEVIRLLSVVHY